MAFITITDLKTKGRAEIIDAIVRSDDTIVDIDIAESVDEAKWYLSRFDLLQLFGDNVTPPTIDAPALKEIVKAIVWWKLAKLSNPNISIELARADYEDAIKKLEKIQSGKADPQGWPYKPDDPTTDFKEDSTVQWSSNPKRRNIY